MTARANPPTPRFSPRAILLIELALAIGAGEFAIMGLMPNVAQGLGISEPQVGHVSSTYALGVVVGAQTLAAASNHAAFNIANALDPWLGGLAISAGLGWTATGYIGAATGAAGLLVFWWAWTAQDDTVETSTPTTV